MSARSSKPKQLGSKQQYRFTKAEDIQKRFREQNEDSLIEALTAFRNQITVKHDESPVPASDGRLLLVKSWLDVSPEALEIFDIWEQLTTRQLPILTPVISVLSALVSLLSSHYTYLSLATPIVKSLLTQRWYSKLNLYLSTSHNELILVTLKLYRALSMFAGGRDRRTVLEVFPWDAKSIPKLLNMRRRKKSDDSVDILLKPDIRTLYVLFLLSFVDNTTSSSVKTSFLDRRRELLVSVFKGLHQDSYSVVRRVLEISWAGIWADPKIKKTMKLALFNEYTVSQLLRLYQRSDPEDHGSEDITADVVHHFLLAICTRPGTGICFKDRGWYPREDVEAEIDGSAPLAGPSRPSSRIYNIILANVLKTLKVNEDARQQELAYRILKVCPELVAGYWPAVSLTLEPRLSTRWIANIAFFGSVISLPVPTTSFHLSDSDLYRPSPPPLTTMTENILPSVNVRIHLSRGLQSSSALVQHCAAVALAKCLSKYGEVLKALRNAEASLEEDEEGQWAIRRQELEREISRRVPEFQVIVAFAQQSSNMTHITSDHTGAQIKGAFLAECAQRLLWSYHQWLPSLVAEARFDVGKLLQGVQVVGPDTDIKINRWTNIRQLHVLRLLKESDQFSLVGKTGSSRGTLSVLLKLYVCCNIQAMRTTLFGLLRHSLSSTILFQHDANELELWLSSLPFSGRTTPAKAPDGTPLTSEEDAVIAFLDDCAQRCLKTPYRYLENLEKTWIEDSGKDTVSMEARTALLPSPLLVAVLEQLEAKLRSDLLSPSDALSVFAFVRRLLWNLAQKTHSIEPLTSIAQTLVSYLPHTTGFGECVNTALRREIRLSTVGLRQTVAPSPPIFCDHNPAVEVFLERIEGVPCPELVKDRRSLACELIDWLRLTDQSLHFRQFERLVDILSRLSVVQRCSLFEYLDPSECLLPEYVKAHPDCSAGFPLLFMHSHDTALEDIAFRDILCKSLACSSSRGDSLTSLQYSLNLIDLRLVASRKHPMRRCNLIYLLHSIAIKIVRSGMDSKCDALLEILRLEGLRAVANDILPDATRNGFRPLLEVIESEGGSECRTAISAFAAEWIAVMESGLEGMSQDKIATASMWIQFAESAGISALLDRYCRRETTTSNTAVVMVEQLVSALDRRVDDFSVSFLPSRISQLLSMRTLLPDSSALERVIDIALRGALPPFVDGRLRHLRSNCTIATSLDTLPSAFSKTTKASDYDVCAFLDERCWTEYTASIVSHLIYMDSEARLAATAWLRVCTLEDYRVLDLAQITHALLDCRDPATWAEADAAWLANLVAVLSQKLIGGSLPPSDAVFYADCIAASLDLPATISQQISKSMDKNLRIQARVPFHSNVLIVARCLKRVGPIVSLSMDVLVNCGLKWAVSVLSEDATTPEVDSMLLDLADLCETASEIDSSTVEALLTSIVHYHLGNQGAVVLAYSVLKGAKVKPVTVNRYIQAIVQHPRIYNFCSVTSVVKDDIVRLLSCLFNMHPTNSCQPSHVEPLLHLYGGTLSRSDQEILRVFLLFERIRKTSVSSLLVNWTPSIEVPSSTTTKALQNLEPNVVWRTCLYFPQWSSSIHESTYDDGAIYDPLFLALMCSLMIAEDLVMPASDWVQLFRTNIFSLFIRALSSNRIDIRQLALTQITAIHQKLQDADVYEKPHVLHILGLLKDLYRQDNADTGPERLPSYATLHLAHALRGVFYPSHFSYPITARFLLQRPELDPDDVPTLYTMLYSTSEQWRKERIWMIHLLSEGMVGRSEWKVLRRRHTWDLVASMLGVQEKDIPLRRGILEFLANLTSNQHAATSLLLRSSLLAWIELQLPSMHDAECIAWVRILDNIVATVNPSKIEAATKGEWRSTMSRCLLVILNHATCTQWTFVQATQVALRLAQLPIPGGMHGNELIKGCMKHLETMEIGTCLEVSSLPNPSLGVSAISMPPHTARGLWEVKESNVQRIWGTCVEALWTICMECESRQPEWYALTQRLLLWRALARYERPLPQWVHKEVVRNIDFLTH